MDIDTIELIKMYTIDHLTLTEISSKVGISFQAISMRLRRAGITGKDGIYYTLVCKHCANKYKRYRSLVRLGVKQYCSKKCYWLSSKNDYYVNWRNGCIKARQIVSKYFPLEKEQIVHHIDGDDRNNNISNLQVFRNRSEFMSYKQGGKAKPVWIGSEF